MTGKKSAPRWVRFDLPGVQRIGDYLPQTAYAVEADEAERLIRTKGFTTCDAPSPADAATPISGEDH